jgi:hypothetical protein
VSGQNDSARQTVHPMCALGASRGTVLHPLPAHVTRILLLPAPFLPCVSSVRPQRCSVRNKKSPQRDSFRRTSHAARIICYSPTYTYLCSPQIARPKRRTINTQRTPPQAFGAILPLFCNPAGSNNLLRHNNGNATRIEGKTPFESTRRGKSLCGRKS